MGNLLKDHNLQFYIEILSLVFIMNTFITFIRKGLWHFPREVSIDLSLCLLEHIKL